MYQFVIGHSNDWLKEQIIVNQFLIQTGTAVEEDILLWLLLMK